MEKFAIAHYGEERPLKATDGERAIFEIIVDIVNEGGFPTEPIRFVRKSDSYVSAVMGPTDIARFKWTDRAKWIQLPYSLDGKTKHPLESPEDIREYENEILGHYFMAFGHTLLGY